LSEDLTFFISALAIQAQEADRPDAAKIADVLKWQDEAGYPSPYLYTAKREQVTGSDSDDVSGGSRIERCAERAA
jgi:hypothetical protein